MIELTKWEIDMMSFYHYCSFDKFESILKTKSLWLTQIVKSNDKEEVLNTFKVVWPKIRKKLVCEIGSCSKSQEVLSILDNQFKLEELLLEDNSETPYGVCLSKNRDLSQNWNEYGDYGCGVCLNFSKELFIGIEKKIPFPNSSFDDSIGWKEVMYSRNNLVKEFTILFTDELKNDLSVTGWLTVKNTLKLYSAFIKNPTFIDEREVRIVYYPNKMHTNGGKTELEKCIDSDFSHCSLPWLKLDGRCALKEVIVGNNCKYDCNDIQCLLSQEGIKNVLVTESDYPYRISDNR